MGEIRVHDLRSVLRPATIALIVPPFAWTDRPSLGLHLLQGIARRRGIEVQVVYANLWFAARFDEGTHTTLCRLQNGMFLAERMFARAAYGTPVLGRDGGAGLVAKFARLQEAYARAGVALPFDVDTLRRLESRMGDWLDSLVPALAAYPIVGCTSSFEQNAAAIAILARAKQLRPDVITLLGGANCEDEMADGVLSLSDAIDHVFSGESEATFDAFLDEHAAGRRSPRILRGTPATDLDGLPTPDYADYYAQLAAFLPHSRLHTHGLTCLAYETSRGCWWGQKSHCTFCGLNGQGMAFRAKSPDRVLAELQTLVAAHPKADAGDVAVTAGGTLQGARRTGTRLVTMTDNIMPHSYFRSLLPRLATELPGVTLMYEQKANLTLAQCAALVQAGITEIQPGIEALSTSLLARMAKGTTAAQNIALLRYAKITGLYLYWNLLYGFPGDQRADYEETIELMPLLVHLQPPVTACQVVFDRFSPYFDRPEQHGIRELSPMPFYAEVLPERAAVREVAYHFEGVCDTAIGREPALLDALKRELGAWRARFHARVPAELVVRRLDGRRYELVDTRGVPGAPERQEIDEHQARQALLPRPARTADSAWALASKVAVVRDRKVVPLATAEADLLEELERSQPADAGERLRVVS